MLVFEWKERDFTEKVHSRCFCWFPAARWLVHLLVDTGVFVQSSQKLYQGAWSVSANYSETVGHKDLRLGQTVYILIFYNISFSWLLHWTVSNLFFCCVTVGRPRRWVSVNDVMFHVPLRANTCCFSFSFQDGAVSLPVSRGDRRLYWASLANEAAGVWSTGGGWCLYYSRSVFISKFCCALKVPAETLVMYLNFFLSTIESQKT